MVSEKDARLLDYLSEATDAGKIRWQPTATDDQFTASLKGKYNVLVIGSGNGYLLRLENDQEQEMLTVDDNDDPRGRVRQIFDAARRVALDVDSAIDDIVSGE